MKKCMFISLLLLGSTAGTLCAQEFKTNESISDQLKNNAQPGMKYGQSTKQTPASSSAADASVSVNKTIKEGRLAGMKPGSGGGAAPHAKKVASKTPLSSDQKADELKISPAIKPSGIPEQTEEVQKAIPKKD